MNGEKGKGEDGRMRERVWDYCSQGVKLLSSTIALACSMMLEQSIWKGGRDGRGEKEREEEREGERNKISTSDISHACY